MIATVLPFNFVITVELILFATNLALNCAQKDIQLCQCKQDGDRYTVDCSHLGLKFVPKSIPVQTTHLNLDDNNLKILPNGSFNQGKRGLPHLVMLSIKRCKL